MPQIASEKSPLKLRYGFVFLLLGFYELVSGQAADKNEADKVGLPAGDDEGQAADDEQDAHEPVELALDKAVEMVLNNEIPDSKTQVGILKTAALVKAGKL